MPIQIYSERLRGIKVFLSQGLTVIEILVFMAAKKSDDHEWETQRG
jgi:hypothetical protein